MDRLQVPLAAAWVFDYSPQEAERNITATNRRAWQLTMLREQNERLARHVKAPANEPGITRKREAHDI